MIQGNAYTFKFWEEVGWFALVAAVIQVITVLSGFQPEAISDWRAWGVALGGGVVRAAAGAALAAATKPN